MGVAPQRKWMCFVCGLEHEDYLGFKLHVLDAHEEGREYVKCPKCDAPVRDVRMHYKVKHPGTSPPVGCALRASVWSDFKGGTKKKVTRKPRFREGDFISIKNGNKAMHYRSGYEVQVYELLEQIPEVAAYSVEPLEIDYLHHGKSRKYRPDLSILYTDGRKEVIEIKPKSQTTLPINQDKWTYAKLFCDARGWDFQVLTEVGIDKLKRRVMEINRRNGST